MALTNNEKNDILDWLTQTIREAGAIVLKYYAQTAEVEWKTPTEPVTAADKASNEFLVEKLRKEFPDYGLLAEESRDDHSRLEKELIWMVDPMDGTKEFISRNGEFSVMIGLVEQGRPVLGAVYQPTEDRLYLGAKGVKAELWQATEARELRVSERDEVASFRLVVSRSHLEPVVDDIRERLGIGEIRQSGSVGLKCGLIARDECDLYIHPSHHTKLWDSCAPQAILEAAGGTMTDIYGKPLEYTSESVQNLSGMLASNGQQHEQIVETIEEVMRMQTV